jgi:hypothetical protein
MAQQEMDDNQKYFLGIAQQAADAAKDYDITNVDFRWLYCQFQHESGNFTSTLTIENHNIGGLTQETPNDSPQPDGNFWYCKFNTYEEYATYFGHYLRYFKDSGVDKASTLEEYIRALKDSPSGAYFGDSFDNYYSDCQSIYNTYFGE